jgi:hypothetical protein
MVSRDAVSAIPKAPAHRSLNGSGRNTCDVACYKATFIDGAGNRFSTNCGIIAVYVPEACPGESRS